MEYNSPMRYTYLILLALLVSCKAEKAIFNGKNLKGWTPKIHHHEYGDNYANTYRVKDGVIQVRYDGYDSFNERYGHLFYKKPYENFHLSLEYKFTGIWRTDAPSYTHLNSGVMFHSQDPRTILKEQDWPISVEMQFLAEEKPGVPRPTGNMCSPGTDVVYQGEKDPRHCIDSNSPTIKPGEWVKAELIVYGDSLIRHIINGQVVLEYTKPTMGGGVVNGADPKIFIPGTPLKSGYIGLQSEGQEIDFRNIKIKKL
ncbi:protein of unknown function DUF1080 [Leadbetterella byssophila DSM 17132]|uniref:3-keto-alpha-glucoside-1,2-lyase/3-keto-2-hydroxy-glucal hydratase domain-containing protein n=1 Tax=Leadbetterella byssophila (strain DSM 17132 / JCM 16389 / KACC 11308 / NBRC 106382 / 4M15) TaxID=649349 RepID=E4RSC0_LEAB4|nr:protein of unknown function DUF1080 [Leadbetterella byssophila DSM 17132]